MAIQEFEIEKPSIEEFPIEEFPVENAAKAPIQEFEIEEFPTEGTLKAKTAGESFKEWAGKRGGQIKEGKYVRGVGGGLIDVLATVGSRPVQAITAGIQAKRTGQGGFWNTLGQYLASGDVRDVQGRDIADVTYGWEPENISGKVLKAGLNIGRDMLGIGGQVKGLSYLTKLKSLSKIPGIVQAGERAYKAGQAISKAENIFDPAIQKALTPAVKGAGKLISSAVENSPDWAKKVGQFFISPGHGVDKDTLAMGREIKQVKNYFSNYTNEIFQNAKRSVEGLAPDWLGRRGPANYAAKERLGKVLIGEVDGATAYEKAARSAFIEKNKQIMSKLSEMRARLKAVGVDNAMEDTFYRVVPPEQYFHRMYKLSPTASGPADTAKILNNINKKIETYSARLTKGTADDIDKAKDSIASLKRLKKAYMKNDMKAVEEQLDLNNLLQDIPPRGQGQKAFGIGGQSSLRHRVLPDYIADVYEPVKDFDSIMAHSSSMDNLMARLEAQTKLIEADPTKAYNYLNNAGKRVSDHFRRWEEAGVFRGIENVIPSIKTDPDTYKYIANLLGEQDDVMKMTGLMGKLDKLVKSTWKNFMLRTPPAIIRNHIDTFLARGAHHGVELPDYMNGVNTALKISKGGSVPSNLKSVYYRLNGQMSTMKPISISDAISIEGVKDASGAVAAIPNKVSRTIARVWDDLGHHFRASDDGLRIAMFNKKVTDFAGAPLKKAIKNKSAVEQAMKYVNDNTVLYDELPAFAKIMQMINPFFAFNFRAPKQYLRAAAKAPTFTAKAKAATARESQRNLERTPEQFRKIYEATQNPLANALSPFGGDIFLGAGKPSSVEGPTVEKISMAPYSFAMRRPSPENFAPTPLMQAKDVALQMSGIPEFGKKGSQALAPVSPLLALQNVFSEKEGITKGILKTFSPRVLVQLAQTLPVGFYSAFGKPGVEFAKAVYPKRGGSPTRALVNLAGIKTEQQPISDVYQNVVNAINLQKQEEISAIEDDIKRLFANNPEAAERYRRQELAKRMPKFDRQLERILKALE